MESQVITISNIGTDDNRCELETWIDDHKNSEYDFESITNIDSSQLKWATEERTRINYAHNIVIPEIQKIINNDHGTASREDQTEATSGVGWRSAFDQGGYGLKNEII